MTIDRLFWEKRAKKDLRRRIGAKGKPRDVILIVCEGTKTEPNYFESFPVPSLSITVFGTGANTETLVQEAIKQKKEASRCGIRFNQVWCVFDTDSFSIESVNNAIALAKQEGIKVAYSNEAFELWYLLHFDYVNTPISRVQYGPRLTSKLGKQYEKHSTTIYQDLLDRQKTARRNAVRLLSQYDPTDPKKDNPSTTVHLLIEELNKLCRS